MDLPEDLEFLDLDAELEMLEQAARDARQAPALASVYPGGENREGEAANQGIGSSVEERGGGRGKGGGCETARAEFQGLDAHLRVKAKFSDKAGSGLEEVEGRRGCAFQGWDAPFRASADLQDKVGASSEEVEGGGGAMLQGLNAHLRASGNLRDKVGVNVEEAEGRSGVAGNRAEGDAGTVGVGGVSRNVAPKRFARDVDGLSTSVTSESGVRVYCKIEEGRQVSGAVQWDRLRQVRRRLLSRPIEEMIEQLERDTLHRMAGSGGAVHRARCDSGIVPCQGDGEGDELWAKKYAPRAFRDLLTDDQLNREVVAWMKAWDAIVFGNGGTHKDQSGAAKRQKLEMASPLGPDRRPLQKIILMCGAPGLGKTTLAHVVARHCGYRPAEVNASDDRSAAILGKRIQEAVEMQSVLGEKKPNCLIIDEVDGVSGAREGQGAIGILVKSARGPKGGQEGLQPDGGRNGEKEDGIEGVKKRKKKAKPLSRPLICICNDLYTPELRPLRDPAIAKVVKFEEPRVDRLVERLRQICREQGVDVDRAALRALCAKASSDMRTCLNTLQFLSTRGAKIDVRQIQDLPIGQKDMTNDAFNVWTQLLRGAGGGSGTEKGRSGRLYSMLQDFGEADLIVRGLQANIPKAQYSDVTMSKSSAIADHLGDCDNLLKHLAQESAYALARYLPASILLAARQAAADERVPLEWPRESSQLSRQALAQEDLIRSWLASLDPRRRLFTGWRAVLMDVIPSLTALLRPNFRPVPIQLFTPPERRALDRVVALMASHRLSINTAAQTWEPGAQELVRAAYLSPPIDRLHDYGSLGPIARGPPPQEAVLHLLAMQLQAQRLGALPGLRRHQVGQVPGKMGGIKSGVMKGWRVCWRVGRGRG
eukprot:evm.model.scf_1894.1 EVM.evm.TU.scf_1894.1   scf_1894:2228-7027(+)